jgi:hypothetical protein
MRPKDGQQFGAGSWMVGHVPNVADKRTESEKDMAPLRAFPGTGTRVPRKRAGLRGLVALRAPSSQGVDCAGRRACLLAALVPDF